MELDAVKKYLEKGGDKGASTIDGLPLRFFERFSMEGLRVDLIEPGRLVCSFKVPTRLVVGYFFLIFLIFFKTICLSLPIYLFLYRARTHTRGVVGLFDTDAFHCMRIQPPF